MPMRPELPLSLQPALQVVLKGELDFLPWLKCWCATVGTRRATESVTFVATAASRLDWDFAGCHSFVQLLRIPTAAVLASFFPFALGSTLGQCGFGTDLILCQKVILVHHLFIFVGLNCPDGIGCRLRLQLRRLQRCGCSSLVLRLTRDHLHACLARCRLDVHKTS